jgi:hypothetical protein
MPQVPIVDDPDMRKKQMERFSEGIGNLGDYAKEMKKSTKINMVVGIVSAVFFLLLIAGVIGYQMIKGGGIEGFIDNGVITRRFNCTSSNYLYNDTIRNYDDATKFHDLYGGECILWKK